MRQAQRVAPRKRLGADHDGAVDRVEKSVDLAPPISDQLLDRHRQVQPRRPVGSRGRKHMAQIERLAEVIDDRAAADVLGDRIGIERGLQRCRAHRRQRCVVSADRLGRAQPKANFRHVLVGGDQQVITGRDDRRRDYNQQKRQHCDRDAARRRGSAGGALRFNESEPVAFGGYRQTGRIGWRRNARIGIDRRGAQGDESRRHQPVSCSI